MNASFRDRHQHVQGHQVGQIEGSVQLLIGGDPGGTGTGGAETGNLDLVVDRNRAEAVGGNDNLHVRGNLNVQADGGVSLTIGMDQHTRVGQTAALEAGQIVHIKAGTTLVLEAGARLSLKVAGNFIDIGPSGISIVGTMVLINSGGSAAVGPGANPEAPQEARKAAPAMGGQGADDTDITSLA